MAAEILTEDLLRISLERLSREVARTHPEFGEMLARNMLRTCSLVPDSERAQRFEELGVLLKDLGRLYLAEAIILRGAPEDPESQGSGD
ncbi:hypothetical protein [Lentzea albidocapillata]|uniref:hypothetical protein n=1 Tax=Lentzea albidocapillata TaxID=40571 RepID=UPI0004C2EE8D|nr:hypothetical protein [Lentzea albidocapillata]